MTTQAQKIEELEKCVAILNDITKIQKERIDVLAARVEELSKAKTASRNVRPAYQAPGAAERRARMNAEIEFRHAWCPAHPGFTREQLEAAIAEWNASL